MTQKKQLQNTAIVDRTMTRATTSNRNKSTQRRIRHIGVFSVGTLFGFFISSLFFFSASIRENLACSERNSKISGSLASASPPAFRSKKDLQQDDEGWKQIHVFYGNKSHVTDASTIPVSYFHANEWFSQYRQDEVVSRLLHGKRNGFFIDLAANDAIRISNTYALETFFDWTGICLEPNPAYWSGLSYRKCDVVAAVVGGRNMEEVAFRFPKEKGPKGGIVGEVFDNKDSEPGESRRRFTVKLLDIFRKFNVPHIIDYISLDVEGAEDLVMSAFPFYEYSFNIMTLERPSSALTNILNSNGYILLKTLKKGTEALWIHHSIQDSLDMSALEIASQNYKYREKDNQTRIAPEMEYKLLMS
jgi:hypothetical protein